TPIREITSASGMSVRTSVAKRGLSRFNPNAPSAIMAAVTPYADSAERNNSNAKATAARNDGNRHAKSHDRVSPKTPAEIHATSGGLVATCSCGVCWYNQRPALIIWNEVNPCFA